MRDIQSSKVESAPAGQERARECPELRFRFECETVDEFGALYGADVSRGGIFIRTQDVLPLATAVKLELLLRNETPFITAEGLVFWTRTANDQGSTQDEPGMGIRFTRMSQDSHRNLNRILTVKMAEDWIREAEHDDEIRDEHTTVAKIEDLRAAVEPLMVAEVVKEEGLAQPLPETSKTSTVSEASALAPRRNTGAATVPPPPVRRALSHPVPLLPDWAFASSRATAGNGAALPLQGAALPSADDVAVPQHIADVRDTSFGARGSVATVATVARASAALVVERKRSLRNHVGLRLILSAALVLVTALALAPRQKSPRSAGKARAAAVAGPSSHAEASPPAARALPAPFGGDPSGPFATAPERLVSSR